MDRQAFEQPDLWWPVGTKCDHVVIFRARSKVTKAKWCLRDARGIKYGGDVDQNRWLEVSPSQFARETVGLKYPKAKVPSQRLFGSLLEDR